MVFEYVLAQKGIDKKDVNINQSIDDGFFNMVLIGDLDNAAVSVEALKEKATALGKELGVEIRVQSEQIFTAMHRI